MIRIFSSKYYLLIALLLLLLLIGRIDVEANVLNLTEACSGTQIYFCTLTNLTHMSYEQLVIVNGTTLQLSELLIRNSAIRSLPQNLFLRAPKLTKFIVHKSALMHLFGTDFAEANNLQYLNLQFNKLIHIEENIFQHAYTLQQLMLGHNNIISIDENAFAELALLKYLDLQANEIKELPRRLFGNQINLEFIDLSNNKIEKIDADTFEVNTMLKTIILNNNQFAVFESNALEHLQALNLLDVSNCLLDELYLQSIDTLLAQNSKLKRLVIADAARKVHAGHNELQTISIGEELTVLELDVRGNLFESLDSIANMLNLQHLDVSHNQLKTLSTLYSPMTLPLAGLTYLNLAANHLQNLTVGQFLVLNKLKHLDLSWNSLHSLDVNVFEGLVNLEKLHIEGNALHTIDYERLQSSHEHLGEIALFGNDWEWQYMRKMLAYWKNHSIEVLVHSKSNISLPDQHNSSIAKSLHSLHAVKAEHTKSHEMACFDGIHPYWTLRETLTLLILIIVALILLLQLLRILQDEGYIQMWCAKLVRNPVQTSARTAAQHSHEPLDEDCSEV